MRIRTFVPLAMCLAQAWALTGSAAAADSLWTDPPLTLKPPPSIDELVIPSAGVRLNGLVYLAGGPGLHPVVVFLHGFPGNERNLDLAQAVRRAGYDAVFVDYRGNWGSGGTFSFANSLADVRSVLAWVRAPETAAKYGFDVSRVAVFGHSFGGWLALLDAQYEPPGTCFTALAAWNVGWAAQQVAAHEDWRKREREEFAGYTDPAGGPLRARPEDLEREVLGHTEAFDYLSVAPTLKDRRLLLIAATRDSPDEDLAMHERLAAAIGKAGGKSVRVESFDDDHAFSSHRIALAERLVRWLGEECWR